MLTHKIHSHGIMVLHTLHLKLADWLTPLSSFQQTRMETECWRFRVASHVKLDNLNETVMCLLSRGTLPCVCFAIFESLKTLGNCTTQYNFHYHVYLRMVLNTVDKYR